MVPSGQSSKGQRWKYQVLEHDTDQLQLLSLWVSELLEEAEVSFLHFMRTASSG